MAGAHDSEREPALRFLVSFFALPRKIALRVFKPNERNRWAEEDTAMMKLSYARSLLGVLIVLAVALRCQGVHSRNSAWASGWRG